MRPPHELLGVSENATEREIEEAYNRRKLYLNPANFEEGTEEHERTEALLLELDEAKAKMLSRSQAPREASASPRAEAPALPEVDYPASDIVPGETRKKLFATAAALIVVAFAVMLLVSLSFTYTSGLKEEVASLNARVERLEAEKNSLKDKLEAQRGKIADLQSTVNNLENSVLDHDTKISKLEFLR